MATLTQPIKQITYRINGNQLTIYCGFPTQPSKNATTAKSYQYTYWLYGEDKIYRQKLKPKTQANRANRGLFVSQVNILKELFVNRTDCYCIQLKQGYSKIAEPLTDETLLKHLSGEITVGSYQLDSASYVKWLCFDFDPEKLLDPKEAAKQVLTVLLKKEKGEDGIERPRVWSSSIVLEASRFPDPSYHIWVLFLSPVKQKWQDG